MTAVAEKLKEVITLTLEQLAAEYPWLRYRAEQLPGVTKWQVAVQDSQQGGSTPIWLILLAPETGKLDISGQAVVGRHPAWYFEAWGMVQTRIQWGVDDNHLLSEAIMPAVMEATREFRAGQTTRTAPEPNTAEANPAPKQDEGTTASAPHVPKRLANLQTWVAMWRALKPYVDLGRTRPSDLQGILARHDATAHLATCSTDLIANVVRAGLAGSLPATSEVPTSPSNFLR